MESTGSSFYSRGLANEKPPEPVHLIQWALSMCCCSIDNANQYTIESICKSNFLPHILHQMEPEIFATKLPYTEMVDLFVEYFFKEFGFYVKGLISAQNDRTGTLVSLILYACIYSPKREKFVGNIMKLDQQAQEKLMNEIEELQSELRRAENWKKVAQVVKNLEMENNDLKNQLVKAEQMEEINRAEIKNLKETLEQTKKQLNMLVVQKRKILANYELSSLAEYQDLCFKLKMENETLLKKQKKYVQVIGELQRQVSFLQSTLNSSDLVISQLNDKYCSLQKSLDETTRELSIYQQSMLVPMERKMQTQSKLFSKTLQTTADMTMPSAIRQAEANDDEILVNDMMNSNSSNFSRRMSLGRSSRNSAAWNVFNTTKTNLLLGEKLKYYEEEVEKMKLKIAELQAELIEMEKKERYYIKKNRKILRLSDNFKYQYQSIIGVVPTAPTD